VRFFCLQRFSVPFYSNKQFKGIQRNSKIMVALSVTMLVT